MVKKWICFLLAVIFCFSLVPSAHAASVPTYKVDGPKMVVIDGKASEAEWGKPIYKDVSLQAAEEKKIDSQVTAYWFDGSNNQDTTFDLYVTNNDYGIAFACVIKNVPPDVSQETSNWKRMNFAFSLSKWTDGSCVEVKTTDTGSDEVYTYYRLMLRPDGELMDIPSSLGLTRYNLFRGYEYQIKYDETAHSLTYEVIVPYNYTNVDISKGNEIAFSALIALNRDGNMVNGNKNGSNRFLIGTGAVNAGKGKFSHKNHCIKIKLANQDAIQKMVAQNATVNSGSTTQTMTHNQSLEMYQGPRYEQQTQSDFTFVHWFAIGASSLIILLCGSAIVLTVVKRKKKSNAAQEGSTE